MSVLPFGGVAFAVTVPILVVGAGAAGLVAALAARESGAEVWLVERDAVPRGSTALSAGLVPAAGTRWQREARIEDTPALFARDIMAKAEGAPDPELVAALTAEAAPTLEWLCDRYGLPFSVLTDFRYPGHSACRMHGLPSRAGSELVDRLAAAAASAGAELVTSARVRALFADDGATVRGVELERPDGSSEAVGCAALILACNGYGANKTLVSRHIPDLAGALYFGHPGNVGDALVWGEALGAATRHLSGHQGHGSVAHPHGILLTWVTITEGGVQVDLDGVRFHDESRGYSEAASVVLRQKQGVAWQVFDGRIAEVARQFADFRQLEAAGGVIFAETWRDLAGRAGLPPEALERTMATVAHLKAEGARDAFGRSFDGSPSLRPPFAAVRVTGALFHTQGGLLVDGSGRVLRSDGSAFPNLWAAGGAACGVSGAHAAGYLSGNGLLSAVVLGRAAGRAAAELAAA